MHRSKDGGVNWEVISPDLTANPPEGRMASGDPITIDATGEEVYSTVYAIRESAVQPGLIWAGSNDGLIHVTRDGGKTWVNVTPKGLPPGGRVQNIDPGVRSAGTAYVAYHRYLLGDFSPHAYRTDDYGKTWVRITTGIAADEPVRVVREDPVRPGLLYAGTEFGMHVSFDRGAHWQSFQIDLPATPITDIRLAHGDLVLSTQGRGFYILDNIDVLRQLQGTTITAPQLLKPVTAVRVSPSADYGTDPGQGPEYRPPGAMIDYVLPAGTTAVSLSIVDASGTELRRFSSDSPAARAARGYRYRPVWQTKLHATPGMHRLIWDLRHGSERGPLVPPGEYTVVMTAGSVTTRQPLTVVADPRVLASGVTNADLEAQYQHNLRVGKLAADTGAAATRLRAALKDTTDPAKLAALNRIAARLLTPPVRYSPPGLDTHVRYLASQTADFDGKIGNHPTERYAELRAAIDAIVRELDVALGPARG